MAHGWHGKTVVYVIFATPCTPHGILQLLLARNNIGDTPTGHGRGCIRSPVQFNRLDGPAALLWLNFPKQQAVILLLLVGVAENESEVVMAHNAQTEWF